MNIEYRKEVLAPYKRYFGGPGSGPNPGGGSLEPSDGDKILSNATQVTYPKESMEEEDVAAVVQALGVPNFVKAQIDIEDVGNGDYKVEVMDFKNNIQMEIIMSDGNEVAEIAAMSVGKQHAGEGTRIFQRMVDGLTKMGTERIEMEAVGSPGAENGFYTWARLGVIPYKNEKLDKVVGDYNAKNGTSFKDLTEMVQDKKGAEHWKQNGFKWGGAFDLSQDSRSREVLKNYVKSKQK